MNHEYKTVKFFKEQRDFIVHQKPVDSKSIVTINYREHITVSASIEINLYKVGKDDELILEHSGKSHTQSKESKINNRTPTDVDFEYRFDDWYGEEDILSLCKLHLTYLDEIIKKAIELGYIK